MIRINNMTKIYTMGDNEVRALDGVSVHIKQHEFVSIIGPSGSGKSTFMNMIGCLDTATSGEYFLDGQEIEAYTENQLAQIRNEKIGFIFQKFNLLAKLTAIENVELPLVYQGVGASERHKRAMVELEKVGLGERANHTPNELSGGQQQRVAIARALVTNPPLLLADEPTGNLDSKSGKEVLQMMKDIHQAGNTIVLITHDLATAEQAERVVRIHDGKITEDRKAVTA